MKRQRGQSAVEFALLAPMILFMIFAAIYGGAMFIQFMNYSNEARTIAREIALQTDLTKRSDLVTQYNGKAVGAVSLYEVTAETVLLKRDASNNVIATTSNDEEAEEVNVCFNFEHNIDFPFGFPPKHFSASYRMQLEDINN
jgi:Flp pilus assembly protein TadG